jgi:DNA-binding winged helix-turn-helix (wHTH) protein
VSRVASGVPRVDEANECLWWGDRRIDLTPKAFLVLRRLMQQANQIVTRGELFDAAWPDTHVSDGVLTLAINQLREAFGDDARQPRFIETVHRRGYRWIGETGVQPQSPTPPHVHTSPAVGREATLAALDQAFRGATRGARQMVFVTGEPGIGKTTVVNAFIDRLREAESFMLARGQCVDGYGASEAYLPLLEAVERLCRETTRAAPAQQLRRLAPTWLLQLPRLLTTGEEDELRRVLAGSGGERMVRELVSFVDELTVDQTLVLVLEDLHWSDHATMAALAALTTRREPARLLVLVSYRPADAIAQLHPVSKLKHELTARRQCVEVALEGLTSEDVGAYLAWRFPHHRLPLELASLLQGQTSGNPLFMLNALEDFVQRGWLVERDGVWGCTVDLATLTRAVPEGTREMIAFRLQQLSAADLQLLEAASVIGRRFATQALAAALEREPAEVEVECTRLAGAEQFLADGESAQWPDHSHGVEHAFRHALYRQVVYARVTPGNRQVLHRRVAARLEQGFASELERIAPQLALQFERGAEPERAVPYHRLAAQQAMHRFAYDETIQHLRAALHDLSAAPAGAERDGQELMVCATLLQPMFATLSTKSTELLHVVEQIQSISARGETTLELLVSLAMLTGHHSMSGDMRAARSVGEQMLARAEAVPWGGVMANVARGVLGYCQVRQGETAAGVDNLEAAMDVPDMGPTLPIDPGIITTTEAAFGHCLLGHAARGRELFHDSMRRVEAARHLPTYVHVVIGGIRVGVALRDDALLERSAAQIAALPEQFQEQWEAWADIAHSGTESRRGDPSHVERILRGEERLLRAGTPFYRLLCAMIATTALVSCGRHEEAEAHLTAALTLVSDTGERWCEAELHRLHGEARMGLRDQQRRGSRKWRDLGVQAETQLGRALDVARGHGARWWELRAAVSLARLLSDGERVAEARDLLRGVYDQFSQGFELPDLRAAREVLEAR